MRANVFIVERVLMKVYINLHKIQREKLWAIYFLSGRNKNYIGNQAGKFPKGGFEKWGEIENFQN